MFGKILNILAKLTNVKIEKDILQRPYKIADWELSETSDVVYQIYITNFSKDSHASFGFWVHGDTYEEATKEAVIRLLKSLKWSYKIKIMKWLKLG